METSQSIAPLDALSSFSYPWPRDAPSRPHIAAARRPPRSWRWRSRSVAIAGRARPAIDGASSSTQAAAGHERVGLRRRGDPSQPARAAPSRSPTRTAAACRCSSLPRPAWWCSRSCTPRAAPPASLIAQQIRGALDELPHPVPVLIVSADPAADTPASVARFLAQVSLTRARPLPDRLARPAARRSGAPIACIPRAPGAATFDKLRLPCSCSTARAASGCCSSPKCSRRKRSRTTSASSSANDLRLASSPRRIDGG